MGKIVVLTYALLAVLLFGGAAIVWIRRKTAELRGHKLPPMRLL